jgi:hypothetical protein
MAEQERSKCIEPPAYVPPPLPYGMTEAQREALYSMAREADKRAESMIRSFSGSDQVDSERFYAERRVYVAVAHGTSVDEVIDAEDKRWRAFAAEQKRKVDAAPKITRGPSSGHSVISHRWVDPERFLHYAKTHIRHMVSMALSK